MSPKTVLAALLFGFFTFLMPGKEEWVLAQLGSQYNCVEGSDRSEFPDYLFLMTMGKLKLFFIWKAILKNTFIKFFFLFYLNFTKSRKYNPTKQLAINQLSCWPCLSKQRQVALCLFFQTPKTSFSHRQHMDDIELNIYMDYPRKLFCAAIP